MPELVPGDVFHDPDFTFQDGHTGNKLFVLLGVSQAGVCVVARTTSNPAAKSRSFGCHHDDRFPNFFVPREAGLFREDTWINLDYLSEFQAVGLTQRLAQQRVRRLKFRLTPRLLAELASCALDADGTTAAQAHILRATLASFSSGA